MQICPNDLATYALPVLCGYNCETVLSTGKDVNLLIEMSILCKHWHCESNWSWLLYKTI